MKRTTASILLFAGLALAGKEALPSGALPPRQPRASRVSFYEKNPHGAPALASPSQSKSAAAFQKGGKPDIDGGPSPDSLLAQGKLLLEKKRYEEAIGVFEQAAKLYPQSADAWLLLGDACELRAPGDPGGKAFLAYKKANDIRRDDLEILKKFGRTGLAFGAYKDAIDALGDAAQLYPNDIEANYLAAYAYFVASQSRKAAAAIGASASNALAEAGFFASRAVKLEPQNPQANYLAAVIEYSYHEITSEGNIAYAKKCIEVAQASIGQFDAKTQLEISELGKRIFDAYSYQQKHGGGSSSAPGKRE